MSGGRPPEWEVDFDPVDEPEAGSTVRVTTGGDRRRVVALGLVVLVLVVVILMLVERDQEPLDPAIDDPAPELADPRPTDPPPVDPADLAGGFESVAGFEDVALIRVSAADGAVVQFPLDGSDDPVVLIDDDRSRLAGAALPEALIGPMLVGRFGGVSLADGSEWGASLGPPHDGLPGPFEAWTTGSDTVVMRSGRSFVELTATGDQIDAFAPRFEVLGGMTVGVAGRHLVHESPHGLHRFDLDTGQLAGFGSGRIVAIGSSLVLVDSCDERFECRWRVVSIEDGAEVAVLPPELAAPVDVASAVEPVFSPDETRLVVVSGREVLVVDTTPGGGEVLGLVATLPPDVDAAAWSGSVTVLWGTDSSRGLLITHRPRVTSDDRPLVDVVSFDRDLAGVTDHDDLGALLGATGPRGAGAGYVLSDTRFDPPPR